MATGSDTGTAAKSLVNRLTDDSFEASGRRAFLAYRDFGLEAATGGKYRVQGTKATAKMETTGWHYHTCDLQFVYVLKGWVDLEFEGGEKVRVEAGDGINIPPETVHNEVGMSEDFEVLEFVSPAEMGTVPVDPPAGS